MTTLLCAQECFEKANQLFSRGHYLDAQKLYDKAYALDPENPTYASAQQQLSLLAFAFFKKGTSGKSAAENASNCTEGCCECCGEGCCEGLCEGLSNCDSCDGCCDGCDCDCG